MKDEKGWMWDGGVAVFILNLGVEWGWMVNATPQLLYSRERTPLPIIQEA
jgi:hypothetical protein